MSNLSARDAVSKVRRQAREQEERHEFMRRAGLDPARLPDERTQITRLEEYVIALKELRQDLTAKYGESRDAEQAFCRLSSEISKAITMIADLEISMLRPVGVIGLR